MDPENDFEDGAPVTPGFLRGHRPRREVVRLAPSGRVHVVPQRVPRLENFVGLGARAPFAGRNLAAAFEAAGTRVRVVTQRVAGRNNPAPIFSANNFFSTDSTAEKERMYKRSRVTKAPVATSSSVNFQAANRTIALSGREFVTTLYSSATTATANSQFASTTALLRPTDFTLFSWLSGIAQKFEEYKFHSVQFTYEPQCPTTTPGSVALWFDEDPTHTAPANWNAMINTGANVHGAPWAKHVFSVPRHMFAGRRKYYTRSEFLDLNQNAIGTQTFAQATDPLEYYAGLYGFASQDCNASTPGPSTGIPLGKIYLDYSISFQTQATDNYAQTSLTTFKQLSTQTADNSGTGYFGSYPTGSTPIPITSTTGAGAFYTTFLGTLGKLYSGAAGGWIQAGCQYFNLVYNAILATNVWVAKQNLEIVLDVGAVYTAAATTLNPTYGNFFIRFYPISGYVGSEQVNSVVIGSGATQGSIVSCAGGGAGVTTLAKAAAFCIPLYQLAIPNAASVSACTQFVQVFQLKLQAGDSFDFGAGDSVNTTTIKNITIGINPMTFGIAS